MRLTDAKPMMFLIKPRETLLSLSSEHFYPSSLGFFLFESFVRSIIVGNFFGRFFHFTHSHLLSAILRLVIALTAFVSSVVLTKWVIRLFGKELTYVRVANIIGYSYIPFIFINVPILVASIINLQTTRVLLQPDTASLPIRVIMIIPNALLLYFPIWAFIKTPDRKKELANMENEHFAERAIFGFVEALRKNGRHVPQSLVEIPNFPYSSFSHLREEVFSQKVLLQRFAFRYESAIFDALATPFERFMRNLYIGTFTILPLASLVLAFIHSWWWLWGMAGLIIGISRSKRLYNRVILSSAVQSELVFCFLYFVRQISITSFDFRESHYWGQENPVAR